LLGGIIENQNSDYRTVKPARARRAGGMHGENLRKPARARRAGAMRWFPTG
jgi:hypothetical protein